MSQDQSLFDLSHRHSVILYSIENITITGMVGKPGLDGPYGFDGPPGY
jgi:hypothetical protein